MSSFNCRERALLPWIFAALLLISLLLGIRARAHASAQRQSAPAASASSAPAFDVAAIHPHISEPHEHNSIWSSSSDGHFRAQNVSVTDLIHWAYEMPETRILDAPEWAGSTHFNIDATADPAVDAALHQMTSDAGRKRKEAMVQALLADRFHLVMHTETRDLPIYKLVVKGGAKFGELKSSGTIVNHGRDHIEVQGSNSTVLLAEELSKEVGRDVLDETGIIGRYNLMLRFTPDEGPAMLNGQPAPDPPPALFTALEEQLGLKLEPAKGPVQVLIIDHIETPSAN